MAEKSLSYFMREETKVEQVFEVPGLPFMVNKNGEIENFEIKKLHQETITKINNLYKSRTPMKDAKKGYVVQGGEVVFKVEKDNAKATRHIIVEALVYPNLKDQKLMDFYGCKDITDMPLKVFPDNDEYAYVNKKVMEVLGLVDPEEDEKKEVEDAKN